MPWSEFLAEIADKPLCIPPKCPPSDSSAQEGVAELIPINYSLRRLLNIRVESVMITWVHPLLPRVNELSEGYPSPMPTSKKWGEMEIIVAGESRASMQSSLLVNLIVDKWKKQWDWLYPCEILSSWAWSPGASIVLQREMINSALVTERELRISALVVSREYEETQSSWCRSAPLFGYYSSC